MMVAMMLPSLVPMLWRYRQVVCGGGERLRPGRPDRARRALVYFCVWLMSGRGGVSIG